MSLELKKKLLSLVQQSAGHDLGMASSFDDPVDIKLFLVKPLLALPVQFGVPALPDRAASKETFAELLRVQA